MLTALLLIDIQNDYFPGGTMELARSEEASTCAKLLLDHFRRAEMPIVHIQHLSTRPGATFFLPGTPGEEIHPSVQPLPHEEVIRKHFPNSFRGTPLLAHLRDAKIERLAICGMMTHMCVDATVRAAFDHGFECLIAGDACATRSLVYDGETIPAACVHGAFLAALDGVYGKVLPTYEVIAELG